MSLKQPVIRIVSLTEDVGQTKHCGGLEKLEQREGCRRLESKAASWQYGDPGGPSLRLWVNPSLSQGPIHVCSSPSNVARAVNPSPSNLRNYVFIADLPSAPLAITYWDGLDEPRSDLSGRD